MTLCCTTFPETALPYHVHNGPLLITILNHINGVNALPKCVFMGNFNAGIPSTNRSYK